MGRSQPLHTMHWCEGSWLGTNHSPRNITSGDNQPKNGFIPLLSCTLGCQSSAQWPKCHHLLPVLAPLSITWGAAPISVRLLRVPVCPTATSSNNMGLCWNAPMCPGRNTIISLGTLTGRGHGADGSHGASGTSLSWTHCRDVSGTRDMVPHCLSTQTMVLCMAGVLPSLVKGHPSRGDIGTPSKIPRGKVSSAHFPRLQAQGHPTPTSMLSTVWEPGKAFP